MNRGINIRQLICRGCLKMHKNLFDIFTYLKNNKLILDMLIECTNIKIQKDDGLPRQICNDCLEKLNLVCAFRALVVESDSKLHSFYGYEKNTSKIDSVIRKETCYEEIASLGNNIVREEKTVLDVINGRHTENSQFQQLNGNTNCKNIDPVNHVIQEEKIVLVTTNETSPFQNFNDNSNSIDISKSSISVIKEEKPENDVELRDYSENSSSLIVNSSKYEHNQIKCEGEDVRKPIVEIHKEINTVQENSEDDLQSMIFDTSEYEHLKTTLTQAEKAKTKLYCKLCKKSYQFSYYFHEHLQQHMGQVPYKCDQCGKRFPNASKLKQHGYMHTTDRPHVCEECGKGFKSANNLSSHRISHKNVFPYTCDICNKQFKREVSLNVHLDRHKNETRFVCEVCGKSFCSQSNLSHHSVYHNSENSFTCSTCGKSFKTKMCLHYHVKRHSKERPHACSHCGTRFLTRNELRKHIAIHTGAKPYACKVCGKTFRQNGCIARHMRTHTGETPFACEKCPATFKYSHHLKKHLDVHK